MTACAERRVAFSKEAQTHSLPSLRRVLSAGADNLVRIWDTFTGAEQGRLVGHTDGVSCVAVAPDGDRAASAGHDGTVRLWDIRVRKELRRFDGHVGNVLCVAFTPDGNQLVSGGDDGTVRVWPTE